MFGYEEFEKNKTKRKEKRRKIKINLKLIKLINYFYILVQIYLSYLNFFNKNEMTQKYKFLNKFNYILFFVFFIIKLNIIKKYMIYIVNPNLVSLGSVCFFNLMSNINYLYTLNVCF